MMQHVLGYVMTLALAAAGMLAQAGGDAKTAEVLKQARAALGGEAALSVVTGLAATGHVTRAAGTTQLQGDLSLQLALPDRMLRSDSLSPDGGITLVTDQGISGDALLRGTRTFNAPPGAVIRTPPPPAKGSDAEADALRAARAELSRYVVALLLRAPANQPVDFVYSGQAESPDGKADVLDVKGRDGSSFAAKLFLDTATHRPLMLTYRGIAPRMVVQTQRVERGAAPPPGAQAGTPPAVHPPDTGGVVDITLFFDDYRKVGSVQLPHHITREVGGEVSEELTFASIQVNPSFKPGTFDPKP